MTFSAARDRDLAFIVGRDEAEHVLSLTVWPADTTDFDPEGEGAPTPVYGIAFFKIDPRRTDDSGKVQFKTVTVLVTDDPDDLVGPGLTDVPYDGFLVINSERYRIVAVNHTAGTWNIRAERKLRVERSDGRRTHGL